MPNVGDTKDRFGRSYIYLNPETTSGDTVGTVGTWRLRIDDTGTPSGGGGGDDGADLTVTAIAAVDIAAGQLVRVNSSSQLVLADATSFANSVVAGMAMETKLAGAECKYTRNVVEDFFYAGLYVDGSPTNLTPGITYYLSTPPGNWTATPDTSTTGAVGRSCGVAAAGDKMSIEIQSATVI